MYKIIFMFFGDNRKVQSLRRSGVMLGTRHRNGRMLFLYMLRNFFVEVTYQNDDAGLAPEKMETFSSISHLNSHLERDFRTAF